MCKKFSVVFVNFVEMFASKATNEVNITKKRTKFDPFDRKVVERHYVHYVAIISVIIDYNIVHLFFFNDI